MHFVHHGYHNKDYVFICSTQNLHQLLSHLFFFSFFSREADTQIRYRIFASYHCFPLLKTCLHIIFILPYYHFQTAIPSKPHAQFNTHKNLLTPHHYITANSRLFAQVAPLLLFSSSLFQPSKRPSCSGSSQIGFRFNFLHTPCHSSAILLFPISIHTLYFSSPDDFFPVWTFCFPNLFISPLLLIRILLILPRISHRTSPQTPRHTTRTSTINFHPRWMHFRRHFVSPHSTYSNQKKTHSK